MYETTFSLNTDGFGRVRIGWLSGGTLLEFLLTDPGGN